MADPCSSALGFCEGSRGSSAGQSGAAEALGLAGDCLGQGSRVSVSYLLFLTLSDERHWKGRTWPWLFPYGDAPGMLHHLLQPCLRGGLSPSTWTIALQVALLQRGTPKNETETSLLQKCSCLRNR